jgi:hypothetical protein
MKKYLFLLVLVACIVALTAVESSPSSTVGYFKKSIASNTWDTMSLPFNYASLDPNAVFGPQFLEGDVLQDVGTGDNFTYYTGFGFYPSNPDYYPELLIGAAYWVYRFPDNPNLDYYIMGTVDPQPVTVVVNANGWSCFSLNECREIDPNILVIPDVLEGDVIQDVGTGDNFTYYPGFGFYPSNPDFYTTILPTHSYWFYTTSLTGYTWTYTPAARNVTSVSLPATGRSLPPSTIRTKK